MRKMKISVALLRSQAEFAIAKNPAFAKASADATPLIPSAKSFRVRRRRIFFLVFIFSCVTMSLAHSGCKSGCSCKSCSSKQQKSACSCGSASCSGCSASPRRNSSYTHARPATSFLEKDEFTVRSERAEAKETEISDEISEVYKRLQNKALVEAGEVVVDEQEESTEEQSS